MPKVYLTKKEVQEAKIRNLAKRIIRCLPKNVTVAEALGNSQATQSYRKNHVYPEMLAECIKILDLAGYEVTEKQHWYN